MQQRRSKKYRRNLSFDARQNQLAWTVAQRELKISRCEDVNGAHLKAKKTGADPFLQGVGRGGFGIAMMEIICGGIRPL